MTQTQAFSLALVLGLLVPVAGLPQAPSGVASGDTVVFLDLPERPADAPTGTELAHRLTGLSLEDREVAIVHQILSGNVPSFGRRLRAISVKGTRGSNHYEVVFYASCDYLAVGSDQDYLYVPLTPSTAQYVADRLGCTLPTKKMVDIIYARADIKLRPQPIPPSPRMITMPVFLQHTDSIRQQLAQLGFERPVDALVAGHKKDIIISRKIYTPDRDYDRVVIYGWHRSVNDPIQPVYNGHHANYADYSHGVRLIRNVAFLNGDSVRVTDLLRDVYLCFLLSDEGVIPKPYYPASTLFSAVLRNPPDAPLDFGLEPNHPNPFRSFTTFRYTLPRPGQVELALYDVLGRKVRVLVDSREPAGKHSVRFSRGGLPAGVYLAVLFAGGLRSVRKVVVAE